MKLRLDAVLLTVIFAFTGACGAQEKIAIPELLELKTRTQALQQYVLRADPDTLDSKDLAAFTDAHRNINVLVSTNRKDGKKRYVVTWTWNEEWQSDRDSGDSKDTYSKANFDHLFPPQGPRGLMLPANLMFYFVFEQDGSPVALGSNKLGMAKGFIKDLNGDGALELVEASEQLHSSSPDNVRYVTVRELTKEKPIFAAAYQWDGLEGLPWGCAIREDGANGSCEILFGPKRAGTITPQSVFRWDARSGTWISKKPDVHIRVLGLGNVSEEVRKLDVETSTAKSPLGKKRSEIPGIGSGDRGAEEEFKRTRARKVTNPYRHKSLAKLANADLLAWMGKGRDAGDVFRERIRSALPPDFWSADPKTTALPFVIRNRPKDPQENYWLALDDLDGSAAPEEGTVAVSLGNSRTGEEYFLRCSKQTSNLTVIRRSAPYYQNDELAPEVDCDVRNIPLTYNDARQVFQTVWWLDRVRSKRVGEDAGSGYGFTMDGTYGSLCLESSLGKIECGGQRYEHGFGESDGVSEADDSYDRSACFNLAAQLICNRLPDRLAEQWRALDTRPLKARVAELLRLYLSGGLGGEAAAQSILIAGDLELDEIGPELEEMARGLPAPSPREMRLQQIAQALRQLRNQIGLDGTDSEASSRRRNPPPVVEPPAFAADPTSADLGSQGPKKPDLPSQPAPDPRLARLDALYEEEEKLSLEQPTEEATTSRLRQQITAALRWLAIKDDPRKLYEFALEDPVHVFPACRRLRTLDPIRALAALKFWEARQKDISKVQPLLKAIDDIQADLELGQGNGSTVDASTRAILRLARLPPGANADAQAGVMIAIVSDSKRSIEDQLKAMELLLPPADPGKFPFPAVDEFLVRMLDADDRNSQSHCSAAGLALAQRGGGRWWDRIAAKCGEGLEMGDFIELLPALAVIAFKEGEPYRTRLRKLIARCLSKENGLPDSVLWAAWMTDSRELKAEVEKLATSDPSEAEGDLSPGGDISGIRERFHSARKIASLWNEEDPATRAKMLVALGLEQPGLFAEYPGIEPLQSALRREVAGLDPNDRQAVADFVDWCASHPELVSSSPEVESARWISAVREMLGRK